MAELLLIVSLLAVFVFGFYLMSRLNRFLEENRKALLKENESREPSEILLPQGLSDSEISSEIRRFQETHGTVDINNIKGARLPLSDCRERTRCDHGGDLP